ncbi:tRNA (cytidine(34)-2'-O)-methyltransferase [Coralliovum pocilloporae]|uniref:tRNA (cytidine(34)-2'-O)-methyltransferase n=1 Tax=Coralliovum pocilloporae TaxID=3066369 RepID=UPI0033072EC6
MQIALYQPDIPQNTGTILRLSACLNVTVHIIEPAGFILRDKDLRRAAMDYLARADYQRHLSWDHFLEYLKDRDSRLILLTSTAEVSYTDIAFRPSDVLLLGRESAGAPPEVHARADERIRIPMAEGARSLNIAMACSMVLGEALRQTGGFPVKL